MSAADLRRRRSVRWALALVLTAGAAQAQQEGATPSIDGFGIHYAYAHQGTGFFSLNGRSTRVVRIPFAWWLRAPEEGRWGLKLRFPLSFGFHELELDRPLGPALRESVETMAFTPGIELQIPLGDAWRLKPFTELGVGSQLSGDVQAFLWRAGVRSLRVTPGPSLETRLGGALKVEGFELLDGDLRDSYGLAELGLEIRWPQAFGIADRQADPGVYLLARRFLPEIEFLRIDGAPLRVRNQLEAGVSLGTRPSPRLWGLDLPRVGLAYRWGDGLSSVRLNFGFPF